MFKPEFWTLRWVTNLCLLQISLFPSHWKFSLVLSRNVILLTSVFPTPSYSLQTRCQTHIWGDHGCTSIFQTTYNKDQTSVQFDHSSHTQVTSSWFRWLAWETHGIGTGKRWSCGSGHSQYEEGWPGSELWDTKMLKPCKIPTPIPPEGLPTESLPCWTPVGTNQCLRSCCSPRTKSREAGLWGGSWGQWQSPLPSKETYVTTFFLSTFAQFSWHKQKQRQSHTGKLGTSNCPEQRMLGIHSL